MAGRGSEGADRAQEPDIGDEAVRAATGRDWSGWCGVLDEWGARGRSHAAIARHLGEVHGLTGWWAQSVAVGYEGLRGLRARHQRPDGTFTANASRTVRAPAGAVWPLLADADRRRRWLAGLDAPPSSATEGKAVRWTIPVHWIIPGSQGDTRVEVRLTPRGGDRTAVAVSHDRLPRADDVAAAKAWWRERLDTLAAIVDGSIPDR